MIKLTDGKQTISISLKTWDGGNWGPDMSNDFFEVGGLTLDVETEAYVVEDVPYCVEQAMDWKNSRGDFCDDTGFDPEDRDVDVTYLSGGEGE